MPRNSPFRPWKISMLSLPVTIPVHDTFVRCSVCATIYLMSALEPARNATGFISRYSAEQRTAAVAMVAAGRTQTSVAEELNIPISTISMWVRAVEKAVPTFENWRERHARAYVATIDSRLSEIKDDAKAIALAQAGLKDLGLTGKVEGGVQVKVEAWLASPGAQAAIARVSVDTSSGRIDQTDTSVGPTAEGPPGSTPPTL